MHQETYLPPLLASTPVPTLTQIQVSPLFLFLDMTAPSVKGANIMQLLGLVVLLNVQQNTIFSPFYLFSASNKHNMGKLHLHKNSY
jgi:hypothetical protein